MTIVCISCGHLNTDSARFCGKCGSQQLVPQAQKPDLNTVLQGRYRLMREVASGGHGTVYEAIDTRTSQQVAVKAVRLDALVNQKELTEAADRIRQEAALLSQLRHQNIVKVEAYFEEAGRPYLVMEYIEGHTLEQALSSVGGTLSEAQTIYISRQVCAALVYLHMQSPPVIFRDLKPENIMVDAQQNVKLIDFGIARTFKSNARSDTIAFGSEGYAAPEQYGSSQTDQRTDIYALGVMMHHLVTGYVPSNSLPGQLPPARQINPDVTAELSELITRATQRIPDHRWQTTTEFLHLLLTRRSYPTRFAGNSASSTTSGAGAPDLNRPTTKLLIRLRTFTNSQIAGAAAAVVLAMTVLILLLGPSLFEWFKSVPFVCLVGPLVFAAARRQWIAGATHFVIATVLSFMLMLRLFGLDYVNMRLPYMALGALLSAGIIEITAAYLMSAGFRQSTGNDVWKHELVWLCVMSAAVFAVFYSIGIGAGGLTDGIAWVLSPMLGALGWFFGDLFRQSNNLKKSNAQPSS
jgi:serine/threonine-protein kinase